MSAVSIVLIFIAVMVLILLVVILVSQVKSSRHIETLKKNVDASRASGKEAAVKPKVMKGSQPSRKPEPAKPAEAESAVETAPPEIEPVPVVSEPAPSAPVEEMAVEIAEETAVEPETELPVPATEPEPISEPTPEPEARAFEPKAYPEFNNARAVEQLGLSQEEADMFIGELVTQIEEEIPNLDAAMAANDVERLEKVSHMLKGSATSLGEGGVADVLVAFNTYCKEGSDPEILQDHLENLRFYFGKLKEKFAA